MTLIRQMRAVFKSAPTGAAGAADGAKKRNIDLVIFLRGCGACGSETLGYWLFANRCAMLPM
jgi:hypothetical protein